MEERIVNAILAIVEGAVAKMPSSQREAFALAQQQLKDYRDSLSGEDLSQDFRFKSEFAVQQLVRQLDVYVSFHDRSIFKYNQYCFIKAEVYLAVKIK